MRVYRIISVFICLISIAGIISISACDLSALGILDRDEYTILLDIQGTVRSQEDSTKVFSDASIYAKMTGGPLNWNDTGWHFMTKTDSLGSYHYQDEWRYRTNEVWPDSIQMYSNLIVEGVFWLNLECLFKWTTEPQVIHIYLSPLP